MSEVQVLKPLKTWSHLAERRRKPSEYEIVSTNLHFTDRDPNAPYELDPDMWMNRWYKQNTLNSPLKHDDWNAFRDPDQVIYRTYNLMQDGQEAYVYGLFDQFNAREHDKALDPRWAGKLARLYTPARYLFHTLQMASAYVGQMAPASTITNCNYFQMADSFRWLSHTAYRTKELSLAFDDKGFGTDERQYWETDPAWQGFRELMEKVLVTWDWAEAFVAFSLVAKPAVEEAVLRKLGESGRHNGDTLVGLLNDAQLVDAARHRRWAAALVKMAVERAGNADVIKRWVLKWEPLADSAINAYCTALSDVPDASASARLATREFRNSLGL
ncbi:MULTISPECIES: aromatic/alkene monooxygenase hydroxylase subunit beta [Burkholderiaceae]|uniref:Methane/phenol/toluene hydroxylase n=1 Tax=Caballeronia udeis TaxID=1232866 RepID=A0A158GJQ8_9BURK|nr:MULTISPECIES: aromatic/alkene monooxygenase hydroxylase subunit beta [Burkholderiaceae]CAE6848401.1 Toluene-4-monooxygenase system, hydroxylase component subunit beta [Paraburkholderia aspalathi]SAL32117.1 methane/phenol/toluene hydroxylase [Caballeronia udeis]